MSIKAVFSSGSNTSTMSIPTGSSGTIKSSDNAMNITLSEEGVITTPTATKEVTANGTNIDVTNYAKVNVNVPSSSEGITPTGTKEITTNGTHDVTNYASVSVNVPTTGGSSGSSASTLHTLEFDVVVESDWTDTATAKDYTITEGVADWLAQFVDTSNFRKAYNVITEVTSNIDDAVGYLSSAYNCVTTFTLRNATNIDKQSIAGTYSIAKSDGTITSGYATNQTGLFRSQIATNMTGIIMSFKAASNVFLKAGTYHVKMIHTGTVTFPTA